jgi:hypothetical protein
MNENDFCAGMRQVLNTLSEIVKVKDYDGRKGMDYLKSYFGDNRDLFCQFTGFLNAELKYNLITKKDAVTVLNDVIMAAISIGWNDGFNDAKRIYSGYGNEKKDKD